MLVYKNVEVDVELLEEFRIMREKYFKDVLGFPADYMSDSDLCDMAILHFINDYREQLNL